MRYFHQIITLALLFLLGCSVPRSGQAPAPTPIEFTILQLNDVYEIAPIEGGKAGGLARVATVKKELTRENPNTIAVLSGDFLSPSFIGTLRTEDGEKIAGLQMVETLNAMGLDYVTFGNHEFDISDPALLQKRMDQSEFIYTVCNAFYKDGASTRPFTQKVNGQNQDVPTYVIHEFTGSKGDRVRVGIIGVVLPFNQADYVHYDDVTESFRKTYEELKPKVDVVVAITHLNEEEDLELAETVPGIPIFLGGHDHEHMSHYVENTIISKADANAKTVYIHRFTYYPADQVVTVRSTLKKIDQTIADDPATRSVVEKWQGKVGDMMQNMGYDPGQELMTTETPLVCTEARIRSQPTNFGKLTVQAFEAVLPNADVYFINSGSMRLGDNLAGTVTSYDILRTFPYGGPMVRMNVPGKTLRQILQIGLVDNRGEGGYFQIGDQVSRGTDGWLIRGEAIADDKTYKLVLPEFVAQGKEAGLSLFSDYTYDRQDLLKVEGTALKNDVRDIVIWYLGR